MQTEYEKLRTEENVAFDTYKNERKKIADIFYADLQRKSRKTSLIAGAGGGILLGLIFATLIIDTTARNLSYNPNTKKTETRLDKNILLHQIPRIIAITILCAIGTFGIKTIKNNKQNRIDSLKMANEILKKYFDKTLSPLDAQNMPLRATTAAALILNNMNEHDVHKLHTLAADSIFTDNNGHYVLYNDCINIASQMISGYINKNPDLAYNVMRIMRGEEPKTYFVSNQSQKTR